MGGIVGLETFPPSQEKPQRVARKLLPALARPPWAAAPTVPPAGLGLVTDFASLSPTATDPGKEAHRDAMMDKRYRLQRAAARLLPVKKWVDQDTGEIHETNRIGCCQRLTVGGTVTVNWSPGGGAGGAHFAGLMCCGSVWFCAVCTVRIAYERALEIGRAVTAHRRNGGMVLLITYTVRHRWIDDATALVKGVSSAFRFLKAGKGYQDMKVRYRVIGSIKGLEGTYSQKNGHHPHIHELLFIERALTNEQVENLRAFLLKRWDGAVTRMGLRDLNEHGVDVQQTWGAVGKYLAKWGPSGEVAGGFDKTANGGSRTYWQVLDDYDKGDDYSGAVFLQYFDAFKGRSMHRWSDGLKALLLPNEAERTDEEIAAAEVPSSTPLVVMPADQFHKVLLGDNRARVLNCARECNAPKVLYLLILLGVEGAYTFRGDNVEAVRSMQAFMDAGLVKIE